MDLSPCLDLLFADDDPAIALETRIRRAATAGFRWGDMWGWTNRDMAAARDAVDETGLRLNCLTVDPFAPLVDERAHPAFVDSVRESARVAAGIGCPFVVVLAGDELPGVARSSQHRAIVDGLRRAAPIAEASGVTLLLENLNSRVDHVGHYLDSASEALDIVDEVDHPAVRVLYDLYHSVVMGERPEDVLAGRLDRVAHVQIADVPGRHEPGTGTVDWPAALGWLWAAGYRGRIGLEYVPSVTTAESLAYIEAVNRAIS
jgi:hydroxypyruvate isomerase